MLDQRGQATKESFTPADRIGFDMERADNDWVRQFAHASQEENQGQITFFYLPSSCLSGPSNNRAFAARARLPRSEEFHPTRDKQH